jgi:hypothetical protein
MAAVSTRTVLLLILTLFVVLACSCGSLVLYGITGPPMSAGQTVRVNVRNGFGAYATASENLARELPIQQQARNMGTIDTWLRDGHLWFLPNDTSVLILTAADDLAEVQAVTGDQRGRVGWVQVNTLRR